MDEDNGDNDADSAPLTPDVVTAAKKLVAILKEADPAAFIGVIGPRITIDGHFNVRKLTERLALVAGVGESVENLPLDPTQSGGGF